jgi:hypothetical protein
MALHPSELWAAGMTRATQTSRFWFGQMRTSVKLAFGFVGVCALVLGLYSFHSWRSSPAPPPAPSVANPTPPSATTTETPSHEPADAPALARTVFEGGEATTLNYQSLLVTVEGDQRPAADPSGPIPVITGRYQGKVIFSLRIDDGGRPTTVEVRHLNGTATLPQVVIMSYTGGAHCCTDTKILTADSSGSWHLVDGGTLDGDTPYRFIDLNKDGSSELVSVDNSFLYAFGCYACSYAPTRISKLAGLELRDVTREPIYQDFLRGELQAMEKFAQGNHDWEANGYLAGWVAQAALVDGLDAAWRTMLASYDRKSDDGLIKCRLTAPMDNCPESEQVRVSFPESLAEHLVQNGYLTPEQAQRLDRDR